MNVMCPVNMIIAGTSMHSPLTAYARYYCPLNSPRRFDKGVRLMQDVAPEIIADIDKSISRCCNVLTTCMQNERLGRAWFSVSVILSK